jgi:hypothetical protein
MRPLVSSLMGPLQQAALEQVVLPQQAQGQLGQPGQQERDAAAGADAAAEAGGDAELQERLIQVYLEPEQYAGGWLDCWALLGGMRAAAADAAAAVPSALQCRGCQAARLPAHAQQSL